MSLVAPPTSHPVFVSPSPLPLPHTPSQLSSHRPLTSARSPKRSRPAPRRRAPPLLARATPYPPPPPLPRPGDPVQPPCVVGAYRLERLTARHAPYFYYDAVPLDTPSSTTTTTSTSSALTVKLLSLRGLPDWRAIDALRHEAAVQYTLRHPAVPCFVDFFDLETETDSLFLLVTARPLGLPLHEFAARFRLPPPQTRAVAEQLLHVLADLAALSPPVTHGAVSPYTVFLEQAPEPSPTVPDSGEDAQPATQPLPLPLPLPLPPPPRLMLSGIASAPAFSPASPRFVAPERNFVTTCDTDTDSEGDHEESYGLRNTHGTGGRADLYSAGATLHFLVTGKPPPSSPNAAAKDSAFAPGLRAADPQLVAVLAELLCPDAANRPTSAAAALAKLRCGATDHGYTTAGADTFEGVVDYVPDFMRADVPYVDLLTAPIERPVPVRRGGVSHRAEQGDVTLGAVPSDMATRLRRQAGRSQNREAYGRVHVQTGAAGRRLRVAATPPGFRAGMVGRIAYTTMWTSFIAFWTGSVVASGGIGYAMALFTVPFWRVSAGMARGLAREVRGGGELRLRAGERGGPQRRARLRVGEPDGMGELEMDQGAGPRAESVDSMSGGLEAWVEADGVATLTVQRTVGGRIELRGALECVGGASVADGEGVDQSRGCSIEILWEGRPVRLVSGVEWSHAEKACKAVNEFLTVHAPGRRAHWDESRRTESMEGFESESEDDWEPWDV